MAADVSGLVRALGFDQVAVVGHDRGARVAHRWALDRPDEVDRLVLLDIVPTRAMFRGDTTVARGYWHWLFHLQPDLPELLVGDRVEEYLRWFFERWTLHRAAVEDAVDHYVAAFRRPGALRAGFDDYRATFPDDVAHDDEDAERGHRLRAPLLVLWGEAGLPAGLPVVEIWRQYADDVRGEALPGCGHFVPEERPDLLVEHRSGFLRSAGWRAARGSGSPAVGRGSRSPNPTRSAGSAGSRTGQHWPGVECIRSAEYSATGGGPRLSASRWVSWSSGHPPGASAANDAAMSRS